jgi:hypothetical protein
MLPALFDDERRMLTRLATMLCCGAFALLPLTTQTHGIASAEGSALVPALRQPDLPSRLTFPGIALARDPFVADPTVVLTAPTAEFETNAHGIGVVLPPNAGAEGESSPAIASASTVRAVVIGEQSRALVDTGDGVHVFSVGDRLGNATIVRIDRNGLTLSNGARVLLREEAP